MGPGGCRQGGYTGGVLPSHPAREEQALIAKRAPEPPCRGGGVGGQCAADAPGSWTTTPGVNPFRARFAVQDPPHGQVAASWPIRARFRSIFKNVSQNG